MAKAQKTRESVHARNRRMLHELRKSGTGTLPREQVVEPGIAVTVTSSAELLEEERFDTMAAYQKRWYVEITGE